jgi:putative ABC transport system substrate-binding protein
MRRREFITLLGGSAVAWPLPVRAQQDLRRIGLLMSASESDSEYQANVAAFRDALTKLGWVEGRNIRIDYRWGALDLAMAQRFAQELIALQPELIITQNTPTTIATLRQTQTIPIVFATVVDPVGSGVVKSLARPNANVTGFITTEGSLAGKWLELLKEIAPWVARVACVFNPATAPFSDYYLTPFKAAAQTLGVEAIAVPVRGASELATAVAAHARAPDGGLIAMPDTFLNVHRMELTALAARHRLPAVYPFRFFPEVGGLLSYGSSLAENYPRVATYVDRILRGAKPADLPVLQPTKFELVINLKTAKALGLDIPAKVLVLADEVIE